MKIAILGDTIQAGAMTAILSEYGNVVYWVHGGGISDVGRIPALPDYQLDHRLQAQLHQQQFILIDDIGMLPCDVECYLFCYGATELLRAKETIKNIAKAPQGGGRLMINGSSFGLHGTSELASLLPNDEWTYLPDTIQEGNAINSFVQAKQVIVGGHSEHGRLRMAEFLRPIFPIESQMLWMPILDAELSKLSISGMLATRISYMNDLAIVAEKLGVDIVNVRQSLASDSRIGSTYLSPGVGFGGENFSHDIMTLTDEIAKLGIKNQLLSQVWAINEQQKEILFRKLWDYYQSDLTGKTVAIWGASFKENTASIHHSAVHAMLKALWAQGVNVQLHDPEALEAMWAVYGSRGDLVYCQDQYEATKNTDALCVMTAWKHYLSPDYQQILNAMKHPLLLDGRNIYNPAHVQALGFIYEGIGRK